MKGGVRSVEERREDGEKMKGESWREVEYYWLTPHKQTIQSCKGHIH